MLDYAYFDAIHKRTTKFFTPLVDYQRLRSRSQQAQAFNGNFTMMPLVIAAAKPHCYKNMSKARPSRQCSMSICSPIVSYATSSFPQLSHLLSNTQKKKSPLCLRIIRDDLGELRKCKVSRQDGVYAQTIDCPRNGTSEARQIGARPLKGCQNWCADQYPGCPSSGSVALSYGFIKPTDSVLLQIAQTEHHGSLLGHRLLTSARGSHH
jgi:hypothetical protein